ncbi:UbiA family prenyltransferase, partial [Staphylococcus aureus]|uniref:UbiA family prenyltransferase n=1 Tax=Staphylococcus aureus TaxID=1280 RepID=UPI0021B10AF6
FIKRISDFPQLVLGLAFNWGVLVGWAAVHGDLGVAPLLLYSAGIAWTLGYDTIYALQDIDDDAIVGVRSTARYFGSQVMTAISFF